MRTIGRIYLFCYAFGLLPAEWSSEPGAQIIPAGEVFTCTPTAVWDGDGPIWCAEGPKVRLAGIAAREMDGTCNSNQPCPAASAIAARDQLVRALGGPKGRLGSGHVRVQAGAMRCESNGGAGGSRTAAWCETSSGVDLNCAMVASGKVLRWARYWRNHRCR
jgi:endonuclease YncB( thermonuclease family)